MDKQEQGSKLVIAEVFTAIFIAMIGIFIVYAIIGISTAHVDLFTVDDILSDQDCTLDDDPSGGINSVECHVGLGWTTVDPSDYTVVDNVVTVSSEVWS